MKHRVVVTGLGVVAPNANNVADFEQALRGGQSGIERIEQMQELQFGCQVAGVPKGIDALAQRHFAQHALLGMNSAHRYGALAALEAWRDAGLARPAPDDPTVDWESGAVIGTGVGGIDTIARVVALIDAGKTKRLGSWIVEQVMTSGVSACIAAILGLGNQVMANSSACATGTAAIVEGLNRVRFGLATRVLVGAAEGASVHTWAGFDAMRVLAREFNDAPDRASRPLSASACGFVPAAGAGVLVVERLESALARGAGIYAEVLGGTTNCGAQRNGGTASAANPEGAERCICTALADAQVEPEEIDAINGHFTATGGDLRELGIWTRALGRAPERFPAVTATKSMVGHALGAAGAVEGVASVLMLHRQFLHPNLNCEDLHQEAYSYAAAIRRPVSQPFPLRTLMKAAFGFGDVNACVILRRWGA